MTEPSTKKELAELQVAVRRFEDAFAKIEKAYPALERELEKAVESADRSRIDLQTTRMIDLTRAMSETIVLSDGARSAIEALRMDPDRLQANWKTLEQVSALVDKRRVTLSGLIDKARKAVSNAAHAGASIATSVEELRVQVTGIRTRLWKIDEVHVAAHRTLDDAKSALEAATKVHAREAYDLQRKKVAKLDIAAISKQLEDVWSWWPDRAEVRKADKKLASDLDGARATLDELEKALEKLAAERTALLAQYREHPNWTPDLIDPADEDDFDVRKAAKLLAIDKKDHPKLLKVLEADRSLYVKLFAKLAKDLDLAEQDGKKIVALLVKAKVIER